MTNFVTVGPLRELNTNSIHEFFIDEKKDGKKILVIITTGGEEFEFKDKAEAEQLFTQLMQVKAQSQSFAFAMSEFMKYMEKLAEFAANAQHVTQQGAKP